MPVDLEASVPVTQADIVVAGPIVVADRPRGVAFVAKTVLDRVGAAVALVLVAPVLLVLIVAIRLTSSGPAFFTQPRVGRNGRVFRIVKLRTMEHGAEAELADSDPKVPGDPRITRVGRVLRRWSLDEVPNLWNVVCGDMSLVGPRPDVPGNPVDALAPCRLEVRPGLTGLWQISGRSDLAFAERVRLDEAYVAGWSFWLDVRILTRTVVAVLRGTGAY
jgi:lipopolysaccharide/colanic/teichoic acid biosynthesis glycosyltransferase